MHIPAYRELYRLAVATHPMHIPAYRELYRLAVATHPDARSNLSLPDEWDKRWRDELARAQRQRHKALLEAYIRLVLVPRERTVITGTTADGSPSVWLTPPFDEDAVAEVEADVAKDAKELCKARGAAVRQWHELCPPGNLHFYSDARLVQVVMKDREFRHFCLCADLRPPEAVQELDAMHRAFCSNGVWPED